MTVAGHVLEEGSFELAVEASSGGAAAGLASGDAVIVLDTAVTPELEAEGWARDAVRVIQDCRRIDGYVVTDRIEVSLVLASGEQAAAVEQWRDYVSEQVLATDLQVTTFEATGGDADNVAESYTTSRWLAGFVAHDIAIDGRKARCYLKPSTTGPPPTRRQHPPPLTHRRLRAIVPGRPGGWCQRGLVSRALLWPSASSSPTSFSLVPPVPWTCSDLPGPVNMCFCARLAAAFISRMAGFSGGLWPSSRTNLAMLFRAWRTISCFPFRRPNP